MALILDTKAKRNAYTAAHMWMRYHYGRPSLCENCGTADKRMYHWANISGQYMRDRTDWLRLCVPCHKAHDIKVLGGKIAPKPLKKQPSKRCKLCEMIFYKNPKSTQKQWLVQVYCGRACAGKANSLVFQSAAPPSKSCEICGDVFYKKYGTKAEWEARRFCGRKCGATVSASTRLGKKQSVETRALKTQKLNERWLAGGEAMRQRYSQAMTKRHEERRRRSILNP